MINQLRLSLRFLVYQESGHWYGHCLELDIVEAGESPREALANVLQLCSLQIDAAQASGELEGIFRPAPPEYWKLYSMAEDHASPVEIDSQWIKDAQYRELALV